MSELDVVTGAFSHIVHVSVFAPGDGTYEVQPVSVEDTARICVDEGMADREVTFDAAGPATGLLVSDEPTRGCDRVEDWLLANAATLARSYRSELGRNVRGHC